MGLLLTDLRANFATTRLTTLEPAAVEQLQLAFAGLAQEAEAWFEAEKVGASSRRVLRTVDMRYHGQNYELSVPLPDGPIGPSSIDALAHGFAAAHQRMYNFIAEKELIQLVTFRIEAAGLVPKAEIRRQAEAGADPSEALAGRRSVWLPEASDFVDCPIYERDRLKAGNLIAGPAIIEQMDATTVVLPGMAARVEPYLNLVLEAA